MRRLRRAVLCALAGWLLPGAAIVAYRGALFDRNGERRPLRLRARLIVAWGVTGAFLRGGRPGVLVWLLTHSG